MTREMQFFFSLNTRWKRERGRERTTVSQHCTENIPKRPLSSAFYTTPITSTRRCENLFFFFSTFSRVSAKCLHTYTLIHVHLFQEVNSSSIIEIFSIHFYVVTLCHGFSPSPYIHFTLVCVNVQGYRKSFFFIYEDGKVRSSSVHVSCVFSLSPSHSLSLSSIENVKFHDIIYVEMRRNFPHGNALCPSMWQLGDSHSLSPSLSILLLFFVLCETKYLNIISFVFIGNDDNDLRKDQLSMIKRLKVLS
jgi:hypothetical protein